ncbi:MAG: ubiquitin-like protein [Candidatus Hodarchaeota archaeon]
MRKNYRILSVIALYIVFILFYFTFFLFYIENIPLFLVLTISSVAVLSTSTIYTVVQSKSSQDIRIKEKKYLSKPKLIQKDTSDIIEDYFDALPSIEEYVESDETYKDMPILDKFIFSLFRKEELDKISLLGLSKMDKILFIREMLYYDPNERKDLIENMLKNKDKTDGDIIYTPPKRPIEMEGQIRVYVRSLVEPGERTKIIIVDTTEVIRIIKEKIAILFDYELEDFLLSSGGILLQENSLIKDYDIDDDDEIALIPSRKEKN